MSVMNKRLAIGVLALAAFGCDRQDTTTTTSSTPAPVSAPATATAPATAPSTPAVAAAVGELDARETRLVMLKLPGMV
jgi:hypothetical protein